MKAHITVELRRRISIETIGQSLCKSKCVHANRAAPIGRLIAQGIRSRKAATLEFGHRVIDNKLIAIL
jgi:hypothetical protein